MIGSQDNTAQGRTGDNFLSPLCRATSGNGSVVEPKSNVAVEDVPLPYDASCSGEDKATTASSKEATNAISKNLPPAITSFTRDQIISKNCCLSFSK
jgi:hypothetical protein